MHCLSANLLLADLFDQVAPLATWLGTVFDWAWPILLLIFSLGMLIFVHELGHFVVAKLVGIKVEVFALGFGPRLAGIRRGETDYRVSAVPLGGYIQMLGQDDLHPEKRVDDERAFCNKSVGRRFLVIASGAVMNIVCALALFIILFRFVGVKFQRPDVGAVRTESPAEKAGILPGDRIIEVGGKGVRDFDELTLHIAVSGVGKKIPLKIKRPGKAEPLELSVLPAYLPSNPAVRGIGIVPLPWTLTVAERGDYTGPEGLKKGDEIVGLKFEDQVHYYEDHWHFSEAVNARRDKPTAIIALRQGKGLPPITLRPHLAARSHILGLKPPVRILAVRKKSPAGQAGIKPGDVITSFDNHPWPSVERVHETAQTNENRQMLIHVLRAGKILDLRIIPRAKNHQEGSLGVDLEADYQNLHLAGLTEDSVLAKQKIDIPVGARLIRLDGESLTNWSDLIGKLQVRAGTEAKLTYSFADKTSSKSFRVPEADDRVWREGWRFYVKLKTEFNEIKVRSETLPGAIYIGLHKTWFWMQKIYLTFLGLIQGGVKPQALSGPLGIAHLSVAVVQTRGVTYFFYFMAILGVNLAIINFLPIPFLDGGHALFLLLEKIKGSPVSVRVQTIATAIGMGALALLMLFITYQDILRLLRSG